MKMVKLSLKGNPKSNQHIYQYCCRGKFGILYMTKIGKDIKEDYVKQIKSQYKGKPIEEDVEMEVVLYFGDKKRRDIDNYGKLLDCLNGTILVDDSQIQKLTIKKDYSKEEPRIEIVIKPLLKTP
ncbi:MAG: RusA family crossover junction endodeoxyribonuclease [Bacilli bacterium]